MDSTPTNTLFYLLEVRKRLIKCLLMFICVFLLFFYFANPLYTWFVKPLFLQMPVSSHMVAVSVTGGFMAPVKLAFVFTFFACLPVFLFHIWSFIAPALYRREKWLILPLVITSSALFYAGVVFAYCVVLPLVYHFFMHVGPNFVHMLPDINDILSFSLQLYFAFGVAFQVPILVLVLVRSEVVSTEFFAQKRPYVIVLAFVLGMLLTPPDVFSQICLALPLCFLFELGLLLAKWHQYFFKKISLSL